MPPVPRKREANTTVHEPREVDKHWYTPLGVPYIGYFLSYDLSPVVSNSSGSNKLKKSPSGQSGAKQKKPDVGESDSSSHGTPYYSKGTVLAVRNEDGRHLIAFSCLNAAACVGYY